MVAPKMAIGSCLLVPLVAAPLQVQALWAVKQRQHSTADAAKQTQRSVCESTAHAHCLSPTYPIPNMTVPFADLLLHAVSAAANITTILDPDNAHPT
jgi:hypothetical protein